MEMSEETKRMKEDVDAINKKISKLEYEEIKKINDKIQKIQIDLTKNNVLTEQLKEVIKDNQSTMESIRKTMVTLSQSNEELAINLRQQNEKIDAIQDKQDLNDKEFEAIKTKINESEMKSKFDILDFVRTNFINIVVGLGVLSYIIFYTH